MANTAPQISSNESEMRTRRRAAMAVLSCGSAAEIAPHLASLDPSPAHSEIRRAQRGLVMLRGRIGGDGAPFNFGEASVSRAAIKLASGETGIGYSLGRDHETARWIALCDALVQTDNHQDAVEQQVIGPIQTRLAAERERAAG